MKITLDGLDGQRFTLRLPRDAGGEHVVALHDTRRLRGAYEHDAQRFLLHPVEADAVVGEVAWALAEGALSLAGPLTLGSTRIALEIRRDDRAPAVTGDVRCASLDAPAASLRLAALSLEGALALVDLRARHDVDADAWGVSLAALTAQDLSVTRPGLTLRAAAVDAREVSARAGGGLSVALGAVTLSGLFVTAGDVAVEAAAARLSGLRLARGDDGALSVSVDEVTLEGVSVERGELRVRAPSLGVTGLRHGPAESVVEALVAAEVSVVAGLAPKAPTTERQAPASDTGEGGAAGLDLAFLDHLVGRVEADLELDVKVPWIERRVARHRTRLTVEDGAIDYRALERGLSKLEDAVLDFELDAQGLLFEVDAVVWKRPLLRWPLDAAGAALARQGRVRLRTLVRPVVVARAGAKPPPRADASADARFALQRAELTGVRVALAVRGASTLPLAGGTLRLGDGDLPALGALRVGGSVLWDAAPPGRESALTLELEALLAGVEGVAAGARRADVARVQVGHLVDGRVAFRGGAPASVAATLRGVELDGVRLRG